MLAASAFVYAYLITLGVTGMFRSGKSSIQQALFENLAPKQRYYYERTTRVIKHAFECV